MRGFRPAGFKSWKTVLALWCALSSALLLARTPAGTIAGTVKTEAGAGVPHAQVIARAPGGQIVATVLTDHGGRFQLPPIRPGSYRLEVEFSGQLQTAAKLVAIKDGDYAVLDFVGVPAHEASQGHDDLLGPVTFYNHSDFKQSQLKDPSGGGGYSNAASAQAIKILNQYLAPPDSAAAAGGGSNGKPASAAAPREAELERTGSAFLKKKDYVQAVEVFEKAATLYPQSEHLQMGLGLSLFGAGKYPEAAGALREAARLAPDDSGPVVMLAETLQFVNDPAAPSALKRFSELHPANARGHYAYGLSLWRDFRVHHSPEALAGARTEFEKAIQLDGDADAHLQLGMVYDEQKLRDRAVNEYRAVIQVNPKLATAHYRLAQDYERLGDKESAEAEFAQYEQLRAHTSP
ncbi:MAG TPA: tetratricopeptide repeat protein [Terriglobia bacterium]|nr:tetratricopeptide repeat protein [Terriglobia bacterium]